MMEEQLIAHEREFREFLLEAEKDGYSELSQAERVQLLQLDLAKSGHGKYYHASRLLHRGVWADLFEVVKGKGDEKEMEMEMEKDPTKELTPLAMKVFRLSEALRQSPQGVESMVRKIAALIYFSRRSDAHAHAHAPATADATAPSAPLLQLHDLLVVAIEEEGLGRRCPRVAVVVDLMYTNMSSLLKEDVLSQLEEARLKRLFFQLLCAVHTIHQAGGSHGNLTLESVLLNAGADQLKVSGLGSVRLPLESWATPTTPSRPEFDPYTAPEDVLGGPGTVEVQKVDLWRVGCMLGRFLNFGEWILAPSVKSEEEFRKNLVSIFGSEEVRTLCGEKEPSKEEEMVVRGVNWEDHFLFLPNGTPLSLSGGPAESSAVDLVRRLLQLNPKRRLTAAEALAHPYFSDQPHFKSKHNHHHHHDAQDDAVREVLGKFSSHAALLDFLQRVRTLWLPSEG